MWILRQTDAVYEGNASSGTAQGRLNLLRPHEGIRDLTWNAQPLGSHLLQIQLPGSQADSDEQLADAYLRQPDLIATYHMSDERDVRPQIYWRDLRPSVGQFPLAIELWISVQTSLLESRPATYVASSFPGLDVWSGKASSEEIEPLHTGKPSPQSWTSNDAPHLLLFRYDDQPVTYVEMIYPPDCAGMELESEVGTVRWKFEMFPTSLEKGVIRRARVRGFLLPRENDASLACELLKAFVQTAPPLTA